MKIGAVRRLSFSPTDPHVTVALVLSGVFQQFSDPLDWIARNFGQEVKVDRTALMESLAMRGGGIASQARAEAPGNDKKTRFYIKLFGRCEGKLVALCGMSFNPGRMPAKNLEEHCIDIVVRNSADVLGVQATYGKTAESMDGLEDEDPLLRVMPMNVFNRGYFREKIEHIERNRKVKLFDLGEAVLVQLAKPWLYYDVPNSKSYKKKPQNLLPF